MLPKAFSNCYGLLLIIIILGFSLVDVPKRFSSKLDLQVEYKHKLMRISWYNFKLEELQYDLEFKLEVFKNDLANIDNDYIKKKFNQLIKNLPFKPKGDIECAYTEEVKGELKLERIEKDILNYLHIKLKYERALHKVYFMKRLNERLNNEGARKLSFHEYIYYKYLRLYILTPFFFSAVLLSSVILLSEFLNPSDHSIAILQATLQFLTPLKFVFIFNVFLVYGFYLIVHGILKSKFQGFKGLAFNNYTNVQSLIYFSRNISRMTAPACFNIFQILRLRESNFRVIMGATDSIPLFGDSFMKIAPLLLVILLLFKYFNIYSKVLIFIGIKEYDFNDLKDNLEAVEEGRAIVEATINDEKTAVK